MASVSEEDIRSTVMDILQSADLDNMTESKVRKLASERLNADLTFQKKLVRRVVEDYLSAKAADVEDGGQHGREETETAAKAPSEADEEEEQEEEDTKPAKKQREMPRKEAKRFSGDNDERRICQLSNKRNVSIQKFRGKTLVSIREYYEKDGELRPGAKGISLAVDQWKVLKNNVSAIEQAIKLMHE